MRDEEFENLMRVCPVCLSLVGQQCKRMNWETRRVYFTNMPHFERLDAASLLTNCTPISPGEHVESADAVPAALKNCEEV